MSGGIGQALERLSVPLREKLSGAMWEIAQPIWAALSRREQISLFVGADLCCEETGTDKACLLSVSASSQQKAAPTEPH